jgi:enterochelin esterase-like enzyme
VAAGEIEPFIIVMPRYRDWAGPPDNKLDQAVMEDLLPYIENTYRAIPGRDFRAIGGLSKGASWALHLGLTEWETFSIIGLHSLPIFYEDAPSVPGWLEEIPPKSNPRMYLDLSESDLIAITKSTQWFIDLLEDMDIPHEFHIYSGRHNEEYWSEHVEEYIRFYAEEW